MRHVVLYSSVHATDGLDVLPLHTVEVVGVADDDAGAISMITAHAAAHVADVASDRRAYMFGTALWFVRASGPKGLDITAGYATRHERFTYYRAVPVA